MARRPDPMALAADAFRGWLARPAPLDRAFSAKQEARGWDRELAREVWTRLDALVRFGVLIAVARGRAPATLADPAIVRRALLDLGAADLDAADGLVRGDPPAWLADAKIRLDAGDPVERCAAHGVPAWWAPGLAERFGDALPAFLARLDSRPPLWARLARPSAGEEVVASLRRDGLRPTRLENGFTLRIDGNRPVQSTEAAHAGSFEIQDLASQRAGEAVPLADGAHVWDACAGAGGKTLLLAGRLAGRGSVHASDLSADKLAILRKRVARAGWQNVRAFVWEGTAPPRVPREAAGGFDAVLVDAPCSSSGTWRRNPDAKLRFGPDDASGLPALQQRLLTHAAAAVRPGGALVYATCSWARAEDERIVEAFLAEHPGFALERAELLGSPGEDADTLFVAVLANRMGTALRT